MSLPVDPEILGNNKEKVFIYHDEPTSHSKEWPKITWLLPGTSELQQKSAGRLIHISDFILELTGRLILLDAQAVSANVTFTTAATVIYPGSQGDPWWDMAQLCEQVSKKEWPIFNALHPDCQAVLIFDCSSAHESYGPNALWVQNMNLSPGGKQARLSNTFIPCDDNKIPYHLQGQPQSMCYPPTHPNPLLENQPKGVQAVLTERGLWEH